MSESPIPAKTPESTVAAKTRVTMIPLSALHEERGRRKTTEAEKHALEVQLAELRGKFLNARSRAL